MKNALCAFSKPVDWLNQAKRMITDECAGRHRIPQHRILPQQDFYCAKKEAAPKRDLFLIHWISA